MQEMFIPVHWGIRQNSPEQIFRAQDKAPQVLRSMAVRKYFWRQAWLFNIIWFVCYAILLFVMRPGQSAMPDLIWQG